LLALINIEGREKGGEPSKQETEKNAQEMLNRYALQKAVCMQKTPWGFVVHDFGRVVVVQCR
jgi:hypothetical protein